MGPFLSSILPWVRKSSAIPTTTEVHPNEHITTQNFETSHLHQLPDELIVEIDEYLGSKETPEIVTSVARMALRATCRRFHSIILADRQLYWHLNHYEVSWSQWEKKAYSYMIRQASFRRLCSEERLLQLPHANLACCVCKTAHERDSFTDSEVGKMPESRMCSGSQAELDICSHWKVTWSGLKVMKGEARCIRKHYGVRKPCNYWGHGGGIEEGVVRLKWVGEESGKKEAVIEVKIPILRLSSHPCNRPDEEAEEVRTPTATPYESLRLSITEEKRQRAKQEQLAKEKIVEAVRKSKWKLCPHLHAQDAQLWLSPLLNAWSCEYLSYDGAITDRCAAWTETMNRRRSCDVYKCPVTVCDTRFTFFRDARRPKSSDGIGTKELEYLTLRVERYLGELASADDKKWIAQIEKSEQT